MRDTRDLLTDIATKLATVADNPMREAEELLCFSCNLKPNELITHTLSLTETQQRRLHTLINERVTGKPLAYITGSKGFYGREFKVTQHTLIPRPETELIIDQVKIVAKELSHPTVLDIGTGSGCIAITVALEIPEAVVTATDIDDDAIAVAKENAQIHGVGISFIQSDLLENIHGHFDIVLANLPYVPETDKDIPPSKSTIGLQFEPQHALYAGNDGLIFYRKLLPQLTKLSPTYVFLEIDPRQTVLLQEEIQKALSPKTIRIHRDMAGLNRVIEILL